MSTNAMVERTGRLRLLLVAVLGGLLLVLMAAGNTGGQCQPIEPVTECAVDADCVGVAPLDCEGAFVCEQGECRFVCDEDPPPAYEACMSDRDCGPGGTCDMSVCMSCCPDLPPGMACIAACCGQCVYDPEPPPGDCESDADCAEGEMCEMVCESVPCDCPDGDPCFCPAIAQCYGLCVPAVEPPPYVACTSNSDCGRGEYCDASDCLSCCPGAGPNEPCITLCCGQCLPLVGPVPCASDRDCAADEVCVAGLCQAEPPPEQCSTDADCPAGQTCECLPDPSCPMCDVCFFACVPAVEPPPYVACASDSDCGRGEYCDTSDCLSCCPDAGPNEPCITLCCGQCLPLVGPVPCASDRDCAVDEVCMNGLCQAEPPADPCFRTGCSGQICADEPVATTCEWRPIYACYDLAECSLSARGTCGWVGGEEFRACLAAGGR